MKKIAALTLPVLLAACGGSDEPAPPAASTLVSTVRAAEGTSPRWVEAYGIATPSSSGSQTISVAQPGQIVRLLVTPGSMVHAGQPVLEFALAPSAQASFESATTTLATARQQRATTARLLSQQLATRDQLVQADKAVADAAAALSAAQREGGGQSRQLLRAPFDGVVVTIPVAQGDRTQAGAPLATVARRGGIVVTVGLDPTERDRVRPGQPARLQSLEGGTPISGRVLRIDGQLNPTTRLLDVDLTFPAGALLSGQSIKAEIAVGMAQGWVVPHASVVTDEAGAHVFQVVAGKAAAVPVTVLESNRDRDVVAGRLAADRPLIVAGAFQVEDGEAVRQGAR